LLAGRAVHAIAGRRHAYEPVTAVAASPIEPGNALELARGYIERLGVNELYAADLDAILGKSHGREGRNGLKTVPYSRRCITSIASLAPLWLDAGVSSVEAAERALAVGAAHIVVGLETLTSYVALDRIVSASGADRVAFSLDLRNGVPLTARAAGDSD